MEKKEGRKRRRGAAVEAVTEGGVINKSQLDVPSWFDTLFSILIIEEAVLSCVVLSAPGLGSALVKISY